MKNIKSTGISYRKTKSAWQPFYKDELTKADAAEIQSNLADLSEILLRWNDKKNQISKD